MSLTLTINGTDYTAFWRLYESEWSSRAYKGESIQSNFILEDDGTIPHADLASKKIVEVWEDASGSSRCLYRGRIANKTLGRPRVYHGNDMVWSIDTEDSNLDLRGIRVHDSQRNEETDAVRVNAYRLGYLNGSSSTNPRARDSTTMGNAIVSANLVTLDANEYDTTDPFGVFTDILEFTGKTFFVYVDDDGDMQLYYADHTDTSISSDISVVDTDLAADGIDIYAADLTSNAGDHDGQNVISGGGLDTPLGYFELSDIGGVAEGFHDKWEEHFTDDRITSEADAEALITKLQQSRSNEDFRYHSTFYMTADNVHRLKAGMMVPLKRFAADKPTSTDQRAVQVTVAPHHPDADGNAVYQVTTEYGVPRGTPFRRHFHRPVPKPPAPGTPGTPSTVLDSWTFTSGATCDVHGSHEWVDGGFGTAWNSSGWMQNGNLASGYLQLDGETPASASTQYHFTASVRNRGSGTLRFEVVWNNSGGTAISAHTIADTTGLGWVPVSGTLTSPVGTASLILRLSRVGDNSTKIDIDNVYIYVGSAPTTGGTAGSGSPQLIPTPTTPGVYQPLGSNQTVVFERPPTADDDETGGYFLDDDFEPIWIQVDDPDDPTQILGVWVGFDGTEGSAVWLPWPSGESTGSEGEEGAIKLSHVSLYHRFPVWAHRGDIGSDDSLPENTLESVRQAALKGAQGAEIDVRLSSEGTFYLMHDSTVDRTTNGSGAISGMTDSTIDALNVDAGYGYLSGSYSVPTLESVMEAVEPYDFMLSIQLNASSDANATALAEFVLEQNWAPRCIIEVSTLSEVAAIRAVSPALTIMVNNSVSGADADPEVDWLSMEKDTITSLSVVTGKAPKHVKSYITIDDFPANETTIVQNMWDRGVAAYQTDDLDFALAAQRALLYGGATPAATGRWEVVVTGSPPEAMYDGDDWLYAFVED